MIEKLSQLAEQAAADVSRRNFLGHVGRAAAGLAGILAATLLATELAAAAPQRIARCCVYRCWEVIRPGTIRYGWYRACNANFYCSPGWSDGFGGCELRHAYNVSDCKNC